MTLWQENLTRLIDLIEQRLASVADSPEKGAPHAAIIKHINLCDDVACQLIGDLQRDYGARSGDSSGSYTLKMSGLRTSCTSGRYQLLRNWQTAARRELGKAAA